MNFGQIARAANAPGPKSSKLERTALHVVQLADADKSGALNPTEQAQADLRAEKAIRQLVHDNVIGGLNRLAAVAEPQRADAEAMTGPEFTQHFAVLAARTDTALPDCEESDLFRSAVGGPAPDRRDRPRSGARPVR
jgi:hypothetical protein